MDKNDYRICKVNGKSGYFHQWCTTNMATYGIVEFQSGIEFVSPREIQFSDEIQAYLASMGKEVKMASDYSYEKIKIRDILIQADAVSCDSVEYESRFINDGSGIEFMIPSSYHVKVDFNKMAEVLYDAGYRKVSER